MKRIAVIGGGISGIAAALRLQEQKDVRCTLLEASSRLGGVLETVQAGPYLVERSADNFATLIPDAYQLTERYGDVGSLIRPAADNRQAFVLHEGRPEPIPAGFSLMQPTRVWAMLSTPTLSWRGKLRVLGEYWVKARREEADESLQSFATRRLGREAYENLVEPIVSGIFTADPMTLSMQATLPQFMAMERRHGGLIRGHLAARKDDATAAARKASGARYDQFVAPRQGMSAWIDQLADKLPDGSVELDTPVESLQRRDGRWVVQIAEDAREFEGVLLATPAAVTARLLGPVDATLAETVGSIPYASSAVVALVVNRAEVHGRLDGFGLIVPRKEGRQCLAISYTSNKYAGRVPEDQVLLRVFLGGALQPQVVDESDERLYAMAQQEVQEILDWRGDAPRWQAVIRWRHAMPQYLIGHTQRMAKLDEKLTEYPGLQVCGAAYKGVGIPQCVRAAQAAAERVLEELAEDAGVDPAANSAKSGGVG